MDLLILGNGKSRLSKIKEINEFNGKIWACNRTYQELLDVNNKINHIDLIGTVHNDEAQKALKFKKDNNLDYDIITQSPLSSEILEFKNYHGYSTGSELILEAINRNCFDIIYLYGFCFINNDNTDIYTKNIVVCNFLNQWKYIKETNLNIKFKWL